jgi:hypothetical protein
VTATVPTSQRLDRRTLVVAGVVVLSAIMWADVPDRDPGGGAGLDRGGRPAMIHRRGVLPALVLLVLAGCR